MRVVEPEPRSHQTGRSVSVVRYNSLDALIGFREQWNRLAENCAEPEVFTRFEYLSAWLAAQPRAAEPHVISVTDKGGSLQGAAALMYSTKSIAGVSLRTLEFLGSPQNDYADFIYSADNISKTDCCRPTYPGGNTLGVLVSAMQRSAAQVDLVHLAPIKEHSPTRRLLRRFGSGLLRPMVLNWSRDLPDPGAPIGHYIAGGIRPRTLRRIEKEGAVALHVYDTPAAIRENLPVLFKQHVGQWEGTSSPSRFRHGAVREFYFGLAQALSPNVVLCILTLNGSPVASLFGFPYKGKLVVYTLARNTGCNKFHCGLVCILRTMQAMANRGIGSVDFTRGDEPFKSHFADTPSVSYEFLWPRTLKAQIALRTFLAGRDLAVANPLVKRIARGCGCRAEGVSKQRLEEVLKLRAAKSVDPE